MTSGSPRWAAAVKSLATQTGKATGEISSQISAIQELADKAAQAMRRIGGSKIRAA